MVDHVSIATVLGLEDARRAAMLAADVGALAELLADDLSYVHSSGIRDSKTELLDKFRSQQLRFTELRFTEQHARLFDGCAVVEGYMHARVLLQGQAREVRTAYLAVWAQGQRSAGMQWRLHAYQGRAQPSVDS